jgi:hypothetical protein
VTKPLPDTVYISGCSNSHFHYLDSYKDSWTNHLGFSKVINHGVCGSSNDFISRRAWSFCEHYKPELVIVQWTGLPRWETIGVLPEKVEKLLLNNLDDSFQELIHEKVKGTNHFWTVDNGPTSYTSIEHGSWVDSDRGKQFVSLEDPATSLLGLIKNAYVLQNYFQEINQPYLFVNGGDWLFSGHFKYPGDWGFWHPLDFLNEIEDGPLLNVKQLANKIDRSNWLDKGLLELLDVSQEFGSDGTHPGPQTNKNFAKVVKEKIDVSYR